MRLVAIIQARMGSTRLPGKVLLKIGEETMLARVVRRVKQAKRLMETIVATTDRPADDAILSECEQLNIPTFRGSEDDVLDRYYHAARQFHADAIVRITADCPLIDPAIIDRIAQAFWSERADYISNTIVRTFPQGLDVEVFSAEALKQAWERASHLYERAHVTPHFWQHPEWFKLVSVTHDSDLSRYRWTVDSIEDYEFVRAVYSRLTDTSSFTWIDVVRLLEKEPELVELNRNIRQKAVEEC